MIRKKLLRAYNALMATAAVILLLYLCTAAKQRNGDITQKSRVDSVIVVHSDTSTHRPASQYKVVHNHYQAPVLVFDTIAALHEYFTKRALWDHVDNDTLTITLEDTLHMNNLASRRWRWNLKKPLEVIKNYTVTNTEEKKVYPVGLFAGPFTYFDVATGKILAAGPELNLVTRRGEFGAGWDLLHPKRVTVKVLINLRKL